jgi:hypothetical protein
MIHLIILTALSGFILFKGVQHNVRAMWRPEQKTYNFLEKLVLFGTIISWMIEGILFLGRLVND